MTTTTLPTPIALNATPIHPAWLRITHWLNALAVIVMVTSGWRIYNASPIWAGFRFPKDITLGGWLGGALQWHFAGMWLLAVNGVSYLVFNIVTGRLTTKFFPLSPSEIWRDFTAALRGKLAHADLRHYNSVQRLAYVFVMVDTLVLITSGLVIWKSVQFPLLRSLFGGYDVARQVHFVAMAGLVGFIVVHLVLVALVPRTLVAMVRGR